MTIRSFIPALFLLLVGCNAPTSEPTECVVDGVRVNFEYSGSCEALSENMAQAKALLAESGFLKDDLAFQVEVANSGLTINVKQQRYLGCLESGPLGVCTQPLVGEYQIETKEVVLGCGGFALAHELLHHLDHARGHNAIGHDHWDARYKSADDTFRARNRDLCFAD